MNILNKLNQADRKKIEKKLKDLYMETLVEINLYAKNGEQEKDDEEYRNRMWEYLLRETSRINGMRAIMDILGIDYSDWAGKI